MISERSVPVVRKRRAAPEQMELFKPHGGKRRGAGRPPKGQRPGAPHQARPFLHERYPVHVTLRAVSAVGKLRRRCVYQAIREATLITYQPRTWLLRVGWMRSKCGSCSGSATGPIAALDTLWCYACSRKRASNTAA
jgi:hypothetical protein